MVMARRVKKERREQASRQGYEGRRELRVVTVESPRVSTAIAVERERAGKGKEYHEATKNARHDPIEWLYARNKIDDAQKAAGDRVRALVETCGHSIVTGIDLEKPFVDGHGPRESISARRMEAANELKRLWARLGYHHSEVVEKVAGFGVEIKDLAGPNRSRQDHIRMQLCEGLDLAAGHFGMLTRVKERETG